MKIFEGLEQSFVQRLLDESSSEMYKKGELIITEGSVGESAYIIESGEVKVHKGGEDITKLSKGEIVGEISLITNEKRTASVEVVSDTVTVITLQRSVLERLLKNEVNGKEITKIIRTRILDNLSR